MPATAVGVRVATGIIRAKRGTGSTVEGEKGEQKEGEKRLLVPCCRQRGLASVGVLTWVDDHGLAVHDGGAAREDGDGVVPLVVPDRDGEPGPVQEVPRHPAT